MTSVFLVSTGSYSDYTVEAIFSTRELAQAYIDATLEGVEGPPADHFNDIEEFPVDAVKAPDMSARYWEVDLDRHGEVWFAAHYGLLEGESATERAEVRPPKYGGDWRFTGYGPTKEHARRSATDAWREWKAAGGDLIPPPPEPERETQHRNGSPPEPTQPGFYVNVSDTERVRRRLGPFATRDEALASVEGSVWSRPGAQWNIEVIEVASPATPVPGDSP